MTSFWPSCRRHRTRQSQATGLWFQVVPICMWTTWFLITRCLYNVDEWNGMPNAGDMTSSTSGTTLWQHMMESLQSFRLTWYQNTLIKLPRYMFPYFLTVNLTLTLFMAWEERVGDFGHCCGRCESKNPGLQSVLTAVCIMLKKADTSLQGF